MNEYEVEAAIADAMRTYNSDSYFTTAQFRASFFDLYGVLYGEEQCVAILDRVALIVRLEGGSTWMLLPGGRRRFM